jgi:hypothetical protein
MRLQQRYIPVVHVPPTLGWLKLRLGSNKNPLKQWVYGETPVSIADNFAYNLQEGDIRRHTLVMDPKLRLVSTDSTNMITLSEASRSTGRSRVTIRRYLDRGAFPGAVRRSIGARPEWLVPVSDLIAAGLPTDVLPGEASGSDEESLGHRLAMAEAVAIERYRSIERLEAEVERLHELLRIALQEVK